MEVAGLGHCAWIRTERIEMHPVRDECDQALHSLEVK